MEIGNINKISLLKYQQIQKPNLISTQNKKSEPTQVFYFNDVIGKHIDITV